MRNLRAYESFINESVVGKFTTVTLDEIRLVKQSSMSDFGDEDTPKRKAILNTLEAAYNYFEQKQSAGTNVRASLVAATGDDDSKKRLLDLAKTFASSLEKIAKVESGEIEPVSDQITSILNGQ